MKIPKLSSLFSLGVRYSKNYEDIKNVEFSNKIIVFFIVVAFLYFGMFFRFNMSLSTLYISGYILINCFLLYLNSIGKNVITNRILPIVMASAVTLISSELGASANGHFFLVILAPFSVIFIKDLNLSVRIVYFLIPLACFGFLMFFGYPYCSSYTGPDVFLNVISATVFVLSYIVLTATILFYIYTYHHLKNNLASMLYIYGLTERELDIISVLIKGKTNKDISKVLYIEESTVKNHLKQIFRKLHVKNRTELMSKCLPTQL